MLILRYQRLFLLGIFKVELAKPLLAIYVSKTLSKPNTPPYKFIILIITYKYFFSSNIINYILQPH